MKYFSSFSGIGGIELGIQQAYEELYNLRSNELAGGKRSTKQHSIENKLDKWECVGYSEIDKYACQIYQSHFPKHKNYGDITKIIASEIPDHDLFVGGFPCQAFSIAGKRKGFDDTRGTLFFDIARILKEKRPRYLLLENVKGLLSHDNGNTFKTIISTLVELGYDLQWQVLNSKNFGVPQNRERVFIVGHIRGTSRPKVFPIRESNEYFDERNKKGKKQIADTITKKYGGRNARGTHIADFRNDEGLRIRKEFISPNLTTRRHSETDISTMPPLVIGGLQKHQTPRKDGISPCLPEAMGKGGGHTPIILTRSKYKYNELREVKGNSTLRSIGGQTLVRAVLTSDRPKKRQQARRFKKDKEPSFALTGQDIHGVYIQNPKLKNLKKNKIAGSLTASQHKEPQVINSIRRLTPTECERLQGFPDGWTKGVSDTQRYKTLGNALTVNIIREIIKKLL